MSKHIRFKTNENESPQFGIIEDNKVTALAQAPWDGIVKTDNSYDLDNITILSPVTPSKIICIGLNYHARESILFSR